MNLDSKLQISLSKRSGNIVLRRDLTRLASASHLSEALHDLVSDGRLIRLGAGIYAKARPDASGDPQLLAPSDELVREVLDRLGIRFRSVDLINEAGQATLLIDAGSQRISRRLNLGDVAVRYVRNPSAPDEPGETLPADVNALPTKGVRQFVERLARTHHIQHQRTGLDDYAQAVTRAAGDEVELDSTGKLLVALKKKHVINGRQLARLMTHHMREVQDVRSVRGLRKRGLPAQH